MKLNKKIFWLVGLLLVISGVIMAIAINMPHYKVLAGKLSIGTEFAINPCKIMAVNLSGGGKVAIPLKIYNNTDKSMFFNIIERIPDKLSEGYGLYTPESGILITTDDVDLEHFEVQPKSFKSLNLYMSVEKGYTLLDSYEEWISVSSEKIPNKINTELCLKLLINK